MTTSALPDSIAAIARTVLYEGYILWPYRRSSLKNQQRWTFGCVFPKAFTDRHPDDSSLMRTECLIRGDANTSVTVRVRFLHVIERLVARLQGSELVFVDDLEVAGARHTHWQEAAEREVICPSFSFSGQSTVEVPASFDGGEAREWLGDGQQHAAAVVRRWHGMSGVITITAQHLFDRLYRLTVTISNGSRWQGEDRGRALLRTMVSTHTILQATNGAFISQTDPPAEYRAAAAECRNTGAWPVLVGAAGSHDAMLSSPIILYDYPQVAPESPGDFFDASEIDQLMVLSILGLSAAEQEEMAATDPAARAILERVRHLSIEQMRILHGATRAFRRIIEH